METYKQNFAKLLADTEALFFDDNLVLKDGRPTPYFVNMGKFKSGKLNNQLCSYYVEMLVEKGIIDNIDIVFGPSYKGSSIACGMVNVLWTKYNIDKLYEYDRKEAKTHGDASGKKKMFVNNTFFDNCRVYIVDDVATSMATKVESIEKIQNDAEDNNINIIVAGVGIGIDREQTNVEGQNAIANFVEKTSIPVHSVAGINEVVQYLYEEKIPVLIKGEKQPIDEEVKKRFDDYIETYGV
ncbi:MAG: hypothetical protein KAR87_00700 [Candidatus Aenigmarchaeota archaeon]|nr:hypothetical protein [Candidatus Aenigmarchaeota archaeon]